LTVYHGRAVYIIAIIIIIIIIIIAAVVIIIIIIIIVITNTSMIDISRMREARTKIVPVLTGEIGTMKWGPDENLQLFPGHPSAIE